MTLTRRYACVRTWCSWLPTAHGAGGPSGSLLRQLHGRVSPHLPFIIDDITATTPPPSESPGTLGMIVMCAMGAEWKGSPFQFSRGCTFYRSEPDPHRQQGIQIVFGDGGPRAGFQGRSYCDYNKRLRFFFFFAGTRG